MTNLRRWIDMVCEERVIRMDVSGHPVTVLMNPNMAQILTILKQSTGEEVKGLIVGPDLYFWNADFATHGHVAEKVWPTHDETYPYWKDPAYVDGRLLIQLDDGLPTIDFDESLLENSRLLALIQSNQLYFRFPGAGFLNWSQLSAAKANWR